MVKVSIFIHKNLKHQKQLNTGNHNELFLQKYLSMGSLFAMLTTAVQTFTVGKYL